MGQKVNPHGLRVGVIKDWDSRWYARNEQVGDLLVGDKKIRDYLKKSLYGAGIPKIEIERDNAKIRIYLHCARPGMVIGKGGEDIKKIEAQLVKLNGILRRNAQVRAETSPRPDGGVSLRLFLDDETGNLLTLEMFCGSQEQAERLARNFRAEPERIYNEVLSALLSRDGDKESGKDAGD